MMWELVQDSARSVLAAMEGMVVPAFFFLVLGLATKGRTLLQEVRRALPESSLNVQIAIFNLILIVPLLALSSQAMSALVNRYELGLVEPGLWSALPAPLVILLGVFLGDFVGYWRHRLEHTPLLWPSHAVHHSDTEMTWLTLERFHPINRATTFFIDGSALLILGLPPYAVFANYFVRHYYGFFVHADLPWTYGKLGRVFVSPAMHRWHHSANPDFFQTNFATVFSCFDQAFGTYKVPGPCTSPLGVTDDMGATLAGQMTYPFKKKAYRWFLARWRKRMQFLARSRSSEELDLADG